MVMDARDWLVQRAVASTVPRIRPGASSYFTKPTKSLDPALFESDEQLRTDVREWILSTLSGYWHRRFKMGVRWATVWLAGSGITYQWSAARNPGDLDVLIGVDFDSFRRDNIAYSGFSDTDIGTMMNESLKAELWPLTAATEIGPGGIRCHASVVSALTVGSTSPPRAGGAQTASPSIGETAISNGSMGSPSPSTRPSWLDRRAAALSARSQTQGAGTGSSTSTTAMTPGAFADFSASAATTPSGSLVTPSPASSGYFSTSGAIYEVTWYVNPNSADIRFIHPYAAYNVTDDVWTVHPPELGDDWNPDTYFPKDYWDQINRESAQATGLLQEYTNQLRLAKRGGAAERTNAAAALTHIVATGAAMFHDIHDQRRNAFGPGGRGYKDYYNFRWQAHKRNGVVPALHALAELHAQTRDASESAIYGHPLLDSDTALRTAATVHSILDAVRA